MSTLAVKPVDAEWLEAVYKITGTPKPETNGSSPVENTKLKKKLETKHKELSERLKAIKGVIPPALKGKLESLGEDIKAGYKMSAIESRLDDLEVSLKDVEDNGWAGDSQQWADESRRLFSEFEVACGKAQTALVDRAQKRALALSKTETDPLRKKRLIAASTEAKINFISVPIAKLLSGYRQDLTLDGEKKKKQTTSKYTKELQDTRAGIEGIIDNKRFVHVVRREQKPREKDRDAEAKKQALAAARKKLAAMRELDVNRAKEFEAQLKTADSTKTVEKIDTAITLALRYLRVPPTEMKDKQKSLNTKAEGVTKARKGAKGDRRAKLKDLENTTNGTQALLGTGNRKVIEAAEKLAEDTSNASSDPKVATFFSTIDDLKKELGDKNIKAFFPREHSALIESLKKLAQDADPLEIEPSELALEPVGPKVTKLVEDTKKKVEWQKSTKQKMQTLYARIAHVLDEGLFITGKAKKRGMVQKWKEINAAYAKPDAVMKEVDKEILKLQGQANSMFNMKNKTPPDKAGLDKALNADKVAGDKLQLQRNARSQALKEMNERRKKLSKSLKELKSKLKGDPALEDEVALAEEFLKSAKQMGKSKQVADANKKIIAAHNKIERLKKKQPGADDDSEVYLRDKAAGGWGNAIENVVAKIGEIKVEALKVADGDSSKVTSTIDKLTKDVFSPAVFTSSFQGPINELLAAKDVNKKKAAREKVISEIRYIRKQLESNEVLLQLRVNPFNKKISSTPVTAYLDHLELRTTKAIRES
ncbi:MAG TPA: hypothetical protein VHW09_24275 [Bryobacteraceae bacterium]|jgi:hypothetical protein|nr:hypothetical protein [Bryobacteraceae bacterium]